MTLIHGFELVQEREIPELDSLARHYRHAATGAELLSLINQESNKVFGVTFRTPPTDSTGLPHILEHSVLCGSEKYPVKEPFIELIKGSLQTFVNAFTYPDKTCYPVASQNRQDFYNLIDVYLDAVFHPRLTPEILKQEGWHFELDDPEAPLSYKGVVFNEMKGAQASAERVLNVTTQRALFPDGPYGVDSGGDPAVIPDLTWEQFKGFHERYYHPSNARFFFYGDDDPDERLRRIDAVLQDFSRIEVDSGIPLQPRHEAPTRLVEPLAIGEEEAAERKGMVAVSWMLPEGLEAERTLAFFVLSYLLVGSPASPLRKALLDSGLGEGLAGHGVENHYRQLIFQSGLKGVDAARADEVERLILETLERLVEEGIADEAIEAALNVVEFRLRENNTGPYPQGLVVMLNALATWLYEGDPMALLAFEAPLRRIRERVESGEPLFEEMIREHLLDNPHRGTVILQPDRTLGERREAEERQRLEQLRAEMTPERLHEIAEESRALRHAQEQPDSPEALATIPRLELEDLDREALPIPIERRRIGSTQLFYHDLPTSGIVYVDVGLDLHLLPERLLPLAPLFGRALLEMGTDREDYVSLAQRIDRKSGGLTTTTLTTEVREQQEAEAWLFLRGKATVPQVPDLLDIVRDVLLRVDLDDPTRFLQLVLESKVAQEAGLVPSGHAVVNRRLRAHFTEAGWVEEQLAGVEQLRALRTLERRVREEWADVLADLEEFRGTILDRDRMLVNVTIDHDNWQEVEPRLADFLDRFPAADSARERWERGSLPPVEGLTISAPVNYVGTAADLRALGREPGGAAMVVSRYLRATYMWDNIRVQGGAYGAFSVLDRWSGIFSFLSYRDPNLLQTLQTYDRAGDFLRSVELDESELTKAIIGAIGDLDKYQLPDARGYTSLTRALARVTPEEEQRFRDEVLATSVEDFRAFAALLDQVRDHGHIAILAAAPTLEKVAREEALDLEITRLM